MEEKTNKLTAMGNVPQCASQRASTSYKTQSIASQGSAMSLLDDSKMSIKDNYQQPTYENQKLSDILLEPQGSLKEIMDAKHEEDEKAFLEFRKSIKEPLVHVDIPPIDLSKYFKSR